MHLEFVEPHHLSLDVLRARLQSRLEHHAALHPTFDFSAYHRWTSSHRVEGAYRGGSGTIELEPNALRVALHVPAFAWVFRRQIEAFVRAEMTLATRA